MLNKFKKIMALLGYEYKQFGVIGCCRWWTKHKHFGWIKKGKLILGARIEDEI